MSVAVAEKNSVETDAVVSPCVKITLPDTDNDRKSVSGGVIFQYRESKREKSGDYGRIQPNSFTLCKKY